MTVRTRRLGRYAKTRSRWYSIACMVEIDRLDEATQFRDDPQIGAQTLEFLGATGHLPTIRLIEMTIRTASDHQHKFFGLRGGLWRR